MHSPADRRRIPASAARSQSWLRRRLPLVLGVLAGITVCVIGLVGLQLIGRSTAPESASQALCADLTAQNYAALYDLLSPQQQQTGSETQFAASQQELDALDGKTTACAYHIQHAGSSQATVSLTLTRARAGVVSATVRLAVTGGAWGVDSYDTAAV